MIILIFSTNLSEIHLIMGRSEQDIVINVLRSSYKVPISLVKIY